MTWTGYPAERCKDTILIDLTCWKILIYIRLFASHGNFQNLNSSDIIHMSSIPLLTFNFFIKLNEPLEAKLDYDRQVYQKGQYKTARPDDVFDFSFHVQKLNLNEMIQVQPNFGFKIHVHGQSSMILHHQVFSCTLNTRTLHLLLQALYTDSVECECVICAPTPGPGGNLRLQCHLSRL